MYRHLYLFLIVAAACSSRHDAKKHELEKAPNTDYTLKYAKGFTVTSQGSSTLVEIIQPFQGANTSFKYLLVPHDYKLPPSVEGLQVVRVPIKNIVCTSTTHIPLLDYLKGTDKLVGFPSTKYISSSSMRQRIDAGMVEDLGIDKSMNLEKLIALDPDMVMTYSLTGDFGQIRQIQQAGIPVVINAEYLEEHPLGRAEWIKLMGLLLDKSSLADSVFNSIEKKYLHLKGKVDTVKERPTVFSGVVYGDIWYLPGGQNNASKMIHDAGAEYLWADTEETGFLEYSFENVYEKAHEADFWVGVASFNSLEAIRNIDERYADFRAFQQGNVYNYNARMGAEGGNEYLELGYLRPDLILADLITIFHPHLLPQHEFYFYKKLK